MSTPTATVIRREPDTPSPYSFALSGTCERCGGEFLVNTPRRGLVTPGTWTRFPCSIHTIGGFSMTGFTFTRAALRGRGGVVLGALAAAVVFAVPAAADTAPPTADMGVVS